MNPGIEPRFISREIVEAIHEEQIDTYGGLHGVRDENALESAIAAAQNVYHYGGGDIYEIAAAYAFHLAESQAYFDGNKRTGVQAAVVFLEANGVDTSPLQARPTYELMIQIAGHEASRDDLAEYLRTELTRERKPGSKELLENPEQELQKENGTEEGPERGGGRKREQ